jgi:glycosyltransferase involved in cell wall biosynthesis
VLNWLNPGNENMPLKLHNPDSDADSSELTTLSNSMASNRKRVLVVSGTLSGGGAERFASTLLQHLDRQNFEPALCLFRDEISYHLPADVELNVLGHRGPFSTLKTVRRLARVIDSLRPDVVLSTMDYLGMFVGEALRQCRQRPFWVARTSNNPDHQFGSVRGRARKQWLKRVYPQADIFVANSAALAERFENSFRCARGKTFTVLNPVDVERCESLSQVEWPEVIDPQVPHLFYAARFQKHKRPEVLIEAFRVIRQHSPAKLWMCGEGPLRRRIENLLEKYDLCSHVRLLGFRENTFPLLKAATVAVATSDFEGLPNNIIEAQALGIPVVSTRSQFGPEEVIDDGKTGLLVECGDSNAVADAVLRLLNSATLRQQISTCAREQVLQRFRPAATIPLWEDVLNQRMDLFRLHQTTANPPRGLDISGKVAA